MVKSITISFMATRVFSPCLPDERRGGQIALFDLFIGTSPIWAPGDGSDFFDGGSGTGVVVFGVLDESKDNDGNTAGALFPARYCQFI